MCMSICVCTVFLKKLVKAITYTEQRHVMIPQIFVWARSPVVVMVYEVKCDLS
jgi:hypothetical protein